MSLEIPHYEETGLNLDDSAASEEDLIMGGECHTVSDGSETESDGGDEAWQGRCYPGCDSPQQLNSSFDRSDSKISWLDTPPSPLSSSMSDCIPSSYQWVEGETCQICGGGACRLDTLEKEPLVWPEMLAEPPPPVVRHYPPVPTAPDHPLANFVSNLTALSNHLYLFKSAPAGIYHYINEKLRGGMGFGRPEPNRGMSRGRRGHHNHHHPRATPGYQHQPTRRRRGRQPGASSAGVNPRVLPPGGEHHYNPGMHDGPILKM